MALKHLPESPRQEARADHLEAVRPTGRGRRHRRRRRPAGFSLPGRLRQRAAQPDHRWHPTGAHRLDGDGVDLLGGCGAGRADFDGVAGGGAERRGLGAARWVGVGRHTAWGNGDVRVVIPPEAPEPGPPAWPAAPEASSRWPQP